MMIVRLIFMKRQVIMLEQTFRCKGNYFLYLKSVSKLSTSRHYKKNIFIIDHAELIRGNNGKIIGVKLNVYQTKLKRTVVINRPLQLIVPLEIAKATFFTLPLLNSVCDHSTNSICSFGSITMWF